MHLLRSNRIANNWKTFEYTNKKIQNTHKYLKSKTNLSNFDYFPNEIKIFGATLKNLKKKTLRATNFKTELSLMAKQRCWRTGLICPLLEIQTSSVRDTDLIVLSEAARKKMY